MEYLRNLRDVLPFVLVGAMLISCTPRQAIIASDPPAGGAVTGVGNGPLTDALEQVADRQAR
ncbi:MAG: hypothetical protein ACE5FP_09815, partial [Gemmatimonadota bacterium]